MSTSSLNLVEPSGEGYHISGTTFVKKADVPAYLHDSEFYRSLQDGEDDQGILIPSDCMKNDVTVSNKKDLRSLLMTLRFWVAGCMVDSILDYTTSNPKESIEDALSEFYNDFPALKYIKSLTSSKLPMEEAIKSRELGFVKYFLERGHPWPDYACEMIAKEGSVEIMQCALQAGCTITKRTSQLAAVKGHIDCLRFLHEHGSVCNPAVMTAAAKGAQLNCLMYAHQQGVPLLRDFYFSAVANNNFNMLQYLHENDCPWDEKACKLAAASGRMDFLQYMHENGCPWDAEVCNAAARAGQLSVVLYLLRQGCPPSANIWDFTGEEFHQILACFLELGLPWTATPHSMLSVIKKGFMDGLQSLVENGCPWHPQMTAVIVKNQGCMEVNLEMLRFVHERGCPWSDDTCILCHSIQCLTFAHTHGAVLPPDMCLRLLEPNRNPPNRVDLKCFQYAHQHTSCAMDSSFTYYAARDGRLEILKYLHEQGCEWCPSAAVAAAQHRHSDCLGYIFSHGGTNTQNVYDMAILTKNIECMELVNEYPYAPVNYVEHS